MSTLFDDIQGLSDGDVNLQEAVEITNERYGNQGLPIIAVISTKDPDQLEKELGENDKIVEIADDSHELLQNELNRRQKVNPKSHINNLLGIADRIGGKRSVVRAARASSDLNAFGVSREILHESGHTFGLIHRYGGGNDTHVMTTGVMNPSVQTTHYSDLSVKMLKGLILR